MSRAFPQVAMQPVYGVCHYLFGLLYLGSLAFFGCESTSTTETARASKPDKAAATVPVPEPMAETAAPVVTLDVKNWDETLELVAQHKGKIVVLDLWSRLAPYWSVPREVRDDQPLMIINQSPRIAADSDQLLNRFRHPSLSVFSQVSSRPRSR